MSCEQIARVLRVASAVAGSAAAWETTLTA